MSPPREESPTTISTHVLDLVRGGPAVGVGISLEWQEDSRADGVAGWRLIRSGATDSDGRLKGLLPEGAPQAGIFRITFFTGAWFAAHDKPCFYPEVAVCFAIPAPGQHWHVPLLMGPYGYSTYRGS